MASCEDGCFTSLPQRVRTSAIIAEDNQRQVMEGHSTHEGHAKEIRCLGKIELGRRIHDQAQCKVENAGNPETASPR